MLPSLPDDARLWLFAADRALSSEEQTALLSRMSAFIAGWTSHGRPVPAEAALLHGRIVAVGASLAEGEVNAGVSGCGIDSLQHALDDAAAQVGVGWLSGLNVLFRDDGGTIQALSRPAFRRLAKDGLVTTETCVFDLTLDTAGALRTIGVERPAGGSWHGRVFRLATPSVA
ncbi:MAG: hypothetical protein HKN04_10790 [Rhodothermaceae bacterium]|nr:hypothetical protein [Rhodothermaceae bacterium]